MTVANYCDPFLVSAPGKVIIFGEHAAVYGKPAIAAALSLRTYLLVTPSKNPEEIVLKFPDISFEQTWKIAEFPWKIADKYHDKSSNKSVSSDSSEKSKSSEDLVPELVSALSDLLISLDNQIQYSSAYAFVYLYTNICTKLMPGYTFTVRSTLPIGAGLGSSASLSVCLATALGYISGEIPSAELKISDKSVQESKESKFIDTWSFLAEKCIHGNPSGIDNAVACYGGAVMFQRMKSSLPSVRTTMRNFPPFKLLLTNTKQPRRTADLVSKVSTLITDFPKTSGAILDAIDNLTKEGYKLMIRPFFDSDTKKRFRELIRINHGLLISLGVSHPTIEKVKLVCDESQVGDTKLTGAGGGGCAITLLRDEVEEEVVEKIKIKLDNEGFETFETTLGGKGVAISLPLQNNKFDFSIESLIQLKGREDIEKLVGVNMNSDHWRFY